MQGCVLLWNRKLHTLLQQYQPYGEMGHDAWVNSVANVVGTVEIEPEPYICYRLHENNVSGYANGIVQRGIKGVRNYLINKHCTMDVFAQELLRGYSDLMDKDSQAYKTILIVAKYKDDYKSKLRLIHTEIISSCKYPDKLLWYLCVVFGRY